MLPKVFVKFIGKPITPRGFIIRHGVNHLLKVLNGKKFLTKIMILNYEEIWSNRDTLFESFLLSNQIFLRGKNILIVMKKFLQDVRETGENTSALFDFFNPKICMMGSKSLEELL